MSRKGKLPIKVPKGVEVTVTADEVTVKGPKGTLKQDLIDGVIIKQENDELNVSIDETKQTRGNFHGLYRSLIDNMIIGTTEGFTKSLEMIGVGYRAAVKGDLLDLQVGLSHPSALKIPEGITVKVEKNTKIQISGSDKQELGQFAAAIRSTRPPEPYQGKGIRYEGEYVRRKAGKSAKK